MKAEHRVYIGAGSNIGDSFGYLSDAREVLDGSPGITVLRTSGIYISEPYGDVVQDDFLNCVFEIDTVLEPEVLMDRLLEIELELGRERKVHWGPRTIDLDILFFDSEIIESDKVTVPHPELHKRLFVLTPLCDIVPGFMHPVLRKRCSDLEREVRSESGFKIEKSPFSF